MLSITAQQLGKKYGREWIFRRLEQRFEAGQSYAITGPNGSGKSTLMQVLCGVLPPSEGKIDYFLDEKKLEAEGYYKQLLFVAPYIELVEEFTLRELLEFHFGFKSMIKGMDIPQAIAGMYLEKAKNKHIKFFSSGMRQRLKLGLAFYTDVPVLFLDEPTSNMDSQGIDWYLKNMEAVHQDRLVIIASNQPYEYEMCHKSIAIHTFNK